VKTTLDSVLAAAIAVAATLAIGAASRAAAAQSSGTIVIADVRTLRCSFDLLATGTWIEDKTGARIKEAKLAIEFEDIDVQEGTANANGGFGPPHVVVRPSAGNLHFLQVSNNGPLYVTTVFDERTPAGKLKAVHTRHEYTLVSLPGYTSRPEQYYGVCDAGAK
jgi:hypothetical protein